jgi:predicted ATPase with chaperone activity
MPSYRDDLSKASKTVERQISETEKKISGATLQAQDEFVKTCEEMSREVMSRATAEIELGVKLSQKLSAARSIPDVVSAYQEWLSAEMSARSEDARWFMSNSQKFMTTSARLLSNGWSARV